MQKIQKVTISKYSGRGVYSAPRIFFLGGMLLPRSTPIVVAIEFMDRSGFQHILIFKQTLFSDGLLSWNFIFKQMKIINPDLEPKFKYHYYSTHGVCLPNYFPSSTDASYLFSFLLVNFNALCFLSIAVAYVVIYW